VAKWLQARARFICESWILRVHSNPPYVSGRQLDPPDAAQLRQVYADLCSSLDAGRFVGFDDRLAAMTRKGYRDGYRLSDLLFVVSALKEQVWQSATTSLLPEQALSYITALNSAFDVALAYIARVFTEEVESRVNVELERAQWQLAELDRAKSSFINIAAHELKTPLTLLQGYSDILLSELAESSNARTVSIVKGLAAGAKRLQQIVGDVIAVSMIDTEMLALHLQPTSLSHVLNMVTKDLRTEMEDRIVDLRVKPFAQAIVPIYADPQRLYGAFAHIVGNGIKYTPDGGLVEISAHVLSAGPGEEPVVEITFADNGIGIAPERRERIFDKFYGTLDDMRHSSGRTKFKGGGPGLGLAVAKGIIEAHGGKVWAESPGYDEVKRPGTTIHVLLPMRTGPPEARGKLGLSFDGGK
jgi:signal transduction histidine kinase